MLLSNQNFFIMYKSCLINSADVYTHIIHACVHIIAERLSARLMIVH